MTELAKDMEVEIEFVPTDWKTIVNGFLSKYHITGSASIKASRMKAAGFSESYLSVILNLSQQLMLGTLMVGPQ